MVAAGKLGHHTTVVCVQFYLTVERVTQQTLFAVVQGHSGFIAGRFYSEYSHSARLSFNSDKLTEKASKPVKLPAPTPARGRYHTPTRARNPPRRAEATAL
ncbi:hypothetical protein GCM10008940_10930 [Microbulbifer agarilyticus]